MTPSRSFFVVFVGLISGCLIFGIVATARSAKKLSFETAWTARLKSDDSVAKQFVKTRTDDPESRDPRLLLQAGLLVRNGRAVDAANVLQRVSSEWRERPETRQLWGEVFYSLGRLQDSETQFLSLLCEDPSRADVHLWLGVIYYDQMQLDRCLREMQRSIRLAPDDFRPHRVLGMLYHRFYRFSDSARYFQEALRLGGISGQSDIVGHLAQAQLFNRDYSSVVDLIAKVPEPSGEMWAMLAEAHLNLGNDEKLIDDCVENGLKTAPHERRVLQIASQIYIEKGRVEEAIAFLNEILTTVPHYERAHYLLARAYLKMGRQEDYERSMQQFKVAEEIKKEHQNLARQMAENTVDDDSLERAVYLAAEMGEPDLVKLYSIAKASRSSQKAPSR